MLSWFPWIARGLVVIRALIHDTVCKIHERRAAGQVGRPWKAGLLAHDMHNFRRGSVWLQFFFFSFHSGIGLAVQPLLIAEALQERTASMTRAAFSSCPCKPISWPPLASCKRSSG